MSTENNTRRISIENDNDWKRITDFAERRRAQNRVAQRNYRELFASLSTPTLHNPIPGRNLKLRMQRFDQIDETLAPHSQDSAKIRALQLQSTVLDASTSSTSSASVHESIATDPQSLTLFSTTLNETLQTPSFHPELVMSTEDLEALSPMSSLRESNMTIWDGCDVDCLARWVDIGNDSSSIVSKYPLFNIYPADFCSVRTLL
jgi:hypothetical protein